MPGFTFGSGFSIQLRVIAILLAALMLLITREPVDDVLARVSWGTTFFLVGLFDLVVALDIFGLIDDLRVARMF